MRVSGSRWIMLAVLAVAPSMALGQQTDTTAQQAFEARRAALLRELRETQAELSEVRAERVLLEARVEGALAHALQRRAEALLMSPEQSALLSIDSTLVVAQDNLTAQRDRMRSLGDAVRRRTGAVLVVLLRADSIPAGALDSVTVELDDAPAARRAYSGTAVDALRQGAVDELFRGEVLPTTHTVRVTLTYAGRPLLEAINVDAAAQTVTYVQFTVRNGQLERSTWTAVGTSSF